jgi:8-oxo-dGTP pyrophosphatase MutT (NUDIX family)
MTTPPSTVAAVPRAAVSIVARFNNKYALVKRGKEPNKGIWSFPGGKIELGEQSLAAAKRELWEETGLSADNGNMEWNFYWCEQGPICTTDSIHISKESDNSNDSTNVISKFSYHYVISHWFVEIRALEAAAAATTAAPNLMLSSVNDLEETIRLPTLCASDDAMDAMWFDLADIRLGIEKGEVIPGIENVVIRSELMYDKGLLV